ncbi:hypothetical protein BJ741DRAFT_613276 [Chytriomyces cf. hyalinus JEL632]|nr:hypothetical protein BJ741DRAFT_613276 [Chytriomyces cf. hyalinus JEL632]
MGTSAELYDNNTTPAAAATNPATDAPAPPRGQWVFIPDFEEDQTDIAAGMAGTGLEPSGTRVYFDNHGRSHKHNHGRHHAEHHAKHHKHGVKSDSDSDSESESDNVFSGMDSEMKRNFKDQMRKHKEQMKTQRRQMKEQHRQMKDQMRQQHKMHHRGPFGRQPHDLHHHHHHGHHGHPAPPIPPMPFMPPMPQMPHMHHVPHMPHMPPFGQPTAFHFGNGPSSSSVPTSTVPGVPFMFGFTSIPPFEALSAKQQEAADNGAEVIRVAESSEGWVCRETTKNGKAAYEFFKQESAKEKGKEV